MKVHITILICLALSISVIQIYDPRPDDGIAIQVSEAPEPTLNLRAPEPSDGYTLFAPGACTTTYLINISGEVVHTWPSTHLPANAVYMRDNGNLVRTIDLDVQDGAGGGIQEIAWNGTLLWNYTYFGDGYVPHHDIALLPNGNVLILARENISAAEAVAAGRDPAYISPVGVVQSEYLVEIKPTSPDAGEIVWEWHVWDHLIQDYDPGAGNFGVVGDHPELMDINYPPAARIDWMHGNGLDYNPELDQIIISLRSIDEFWVIDHSTNTSEAAGHSGGNSDKGGDILYRWGNPVTYRAGTEADKQLYGQHDATWIKPGRPGEGNILVFNNGGNRPVVQYSSVEEIEPPVDPEGNYTYVPGTAFDPPAPVWNYTADPPTDFYAQATSGAERQPNGNTLICHGPDGYFFEVTPNGTVVWDYQNPFTGTKAKIFHVFKVRRYAELGHDIPLDQGWNLISLPFELTNLSYAAVLEDLNGQWDVAQVYDSADDSWKTLSMHRPDALDDLAEFNHTIGIWIHVTEPGLTYNVMGRIPEPHTEIPLRAGWNLVGYPSLQPSTASLALSGTGADKMEVFDPAQPYLLKDVDMTHIMKPGEGYWIHVPSDTVWTVYW